MTGQLRAHVYRDRIEQKWWIDADDPTLNLIEEEALGGTWTCSAASWPEAMQAAYKMLADLNNALMDEVHASRATRRTTNPKCCVCHKPIEPGEAHWNPTNDASCLVLDACSISPNIATPTYKETPA